MPVVAPDTPAPAFALQSTGAGRVSLGDLLAAAGAVVMFVTDDCPTCELALRRLAAGAAPIAVVCESDPAAAARLAQRTGFAGPMLAEPPPYETSRAYGLEAVPTTVAIGAGGEVRGAVVGWDAAALGALLRIDLVPEPPLRKPGCAAKSTYDAGQLAADAAGSGDDPEAMYELGWTDGLPTVAPTPERVAAMLAGRDPHRSLGQVPPGMGEATLERVAACAVLAGCRPEHFAVVAAAAEAMLAPRVQPARPGGDDAAGRPDRRRQRPGAAHGAASTPAWARSARAPARTCTIGRALRLLVALTGEGMPGRLDRSTLGQPGKVGVCLAEDEERSPWPPLHVERGFAAGGVGRDDVRGRRAALDLRAPQPHARRSSRRRWAGRRRRSGAPTGGRSARPRCSSSARSTPTRWPRAAGARTTSAQAIWQAVRRPAGELRHGEFTAARGARAADAELVPKWDSPADIVLIVAGGEAGRFSAVFGPCVGMDWNPVSLEVRCDT